MTEYSIIERDKCPSCFQLKVNIINKMFVCFNCGWYLVTEPIGGITEVKDCNTTRLNQVRK